MPVPDYQSFMKPILQIASDGEEHSLRDAYEILSVEFNLTPEDQSELLPSGRQAKYKNRIGWARTYLNKAGLLEYTRRGYFKITKRGLEEWQQNPEEINASYLRKYDEFVDFQTVNKDAKDTSITPPTVSLMTQTPEEAIEHALSELENQVADELLEALHNVSPAYFEQIVVELLLSMGYGGSKKEAGEVVGKSGDGGIDGIIKEDRLGLDAIYIQAKRWESVVGRPEIQKFVGALQGHRSQKGIFITTSSFSREAKEYAEQVQNRVVLIDGRQMALLMIEHDIGTTTIGAYAIKRIDSDYFLEE